MATNRWAVDFSNALPIAGVDGSLRRRMRNTPGVPECPRQDRHAQMGQLAFWLRHHAAGEKLAFSLMLNRSTRLKEKIQPRNWTRLPKCCRVGRSL